MNEEEAMLKYVVKYVLDRCDDELSFLDKFVSNGLKDKLNNLINSDFIRITHHDAIDLLLNAGVEWEFTPDYDSDIAKEHEKWLTEHFSAPVFIYNWPRDIKAWYMKLNDDNKTVAAVDLEVPGSGELMGGSEREVRMDKLEELIKKHNVNKEAIDWYINLRKFGGCYHSGFGMGFERLIMYLTGIENIRDVIPFPRTPGSIEY
jgi:asparaginyl-tRNA synthetase